MRRAAPRLNPWRKPDDRDLMALRAEHAAFASSALPLRPLRVKFLLAIVRVYRRQSSRGSRGNAAACARSRACSRRSSTMPSSARRGWRNGTSRNSAASRRCRGSAGRAARRAPPPSAGRCSTLYHSLNSALVLGRDIHRDEQQRLRAARPAPACRRAGSARLRAAIVLDAAGDPLGPGRAVGAAHRLIGRAVQYPDIVEVVERHRFLRVAGADPALGVEEARHAPAAPACARCRTSRETRPRRHRRNSSPRPGCLSPSPPPRLMARSVARGQARAGSG